MYITLSERKEANRYFWIVKGHLIPETWSNEQVLYILDAYFVRIWGNHENWLHEDGFEEAWQTRADLYRCSSMAERQSPKLRVEGSIPSSGANSRGYKRGQD